MEKLFSRLLAPLWPGVGVAVAFCIACPLVRAAGVGRQAPRPLTSHPGNVFLADEEVVLSLSTNGPGNWQLVDYDGQTVSSGTAPGGKVSLGRLPVGWYEVRAGEAAGANARRVSLGVLASLKAPTPATSPIAMDVAMAWFYAPERMPAAANLCALAGVNWVRDRLSWPEMEPQRGHFAASNRYDASAQAQAAAGLRQLQVNHVSPAWANPQRGRFPTDLRDAYNFYREMARRWRGLVEAFEPWNEADIQNFGGHTGSEIASLQKAAYLGLKAGNPKVIACQNVFALSKRAILDDFQENAAWPYFDTFNLHHYVGLDAYAKVYGEFRSVSAGKPLWVTECNVPVPWSGDERLKEPSPADLRVQAERVAGVFATALHEGGAPVFYFLFPHYVEGQTQFGIVRPDLTPRPAYVALAAVGRLLADARPLGRLPAADAKARAFVFAARPDGRARQVLVAWASSGTAKLALPAAPEALFDVMGRERAFSGAELTLTTAPAFALFPAGTAKRMNLTSPPKPAPLLKGMPSPVVLQAIRPKEMVLLAHSAYRLDASRPETIPIRVYNFSQREVRGRFKVQAPPGWSVEFPAQLRLPAATDSEVKLTVCAHNQVGTTTVDKLTIQGDFGRAGRPLLALRFKAN
jgi:hypothetical protein